MDQLINIEISLNDFRDLTYHQFPSACSGSIVISSIFTKVMGS